jgi:hypothetical protein
VQKGQGSVLTFEFGQPHLSIREPRETQSEISSIRERFKRRRVVPKGEWNLFVFCCHWRCTLNGTELSTDDSSDHDILAAAAKLDGQRLISVYADPISRTSSFDFDLCGKLVTWPYKDCEEREQWSLRTPSGNYLVFRDDAKYRWVPGNQPSNEQVWLPLPVIGQR